MTADMYQPGLIARLARQYPARDVQWIADEIAQAAASGNIRSPNGALIAGCRRADLEDSHRAGTRPSAALTQTRAPGGFWPNGDWNSEGYGVSALDGFMRRLVAIRRDTCDPPSTFALMIRQPEHARFAAAFRPQTLDAWLEHDDPEDWPCMLTRTACEEHVKRCGYPNHGFTWGPKRGIHWVSKAALAAARQQHEPSCAEVIDDDARAALAGFDPAPPAAAEVPQEEMAW